MPTDSQHHAQHDPLLVVSLAAGDLTGADRDLAASLITDCAECATLHVDLLSIAGGTATLPAAVRPRDFQLNPEQAARLRPAGWRRFVAGFASPRLAVTRQLGVGLTTIGLAGLLVSVLPTIQIGLGSAASRPATTSEQAVGAPDTAGSGGEAAPSVVPPVAASGAAAAASPAATQRAPLIDGQPSGSDYGLLTPYASPDPVKTSASDGGETAGVVTAQGAEDAKSAAADRDLLTQSPSEGPGISLVLVGSAILLAAGIALLVARRFARHLTGG
jgi:AhpD family alkylhydroperoxidase